MNWFRTGSAAVNTATSGPARTVDRVVGEGVDAFAAARERAATLRLVADARVCVPERVTMRKDGVVVATMPSVEGVNLDALLARRGYLSLGECVYLGVHLCGALATLHKSGLAHGDLSLANVMVTRSGIVVVDTVGGGLPHEVGTEGFRAPERTKGASMQGDVYSVGAVLAACVDPVMRQGFMGWLDPLLDPNAASRPSASGIEAGLGRCAKAVPIQLGEWGVAGELRAHAHEPRERTTVLRSSRPWRMRRLGLRVAITGLAALAVIVAAAYVIPRTDSAAAGSDPERSAPPGDITGHAGPSAQPSAVERRTDEVSATDAARDLTNARFAALAEGDGAALIATGVPDTEVAAQLQVQASALTAGDLRFHGLSATVVAVEPSSAGDGGLPWVTVTYVVSEHSVWSRDPATGVEEVTDVSAHKEIARLELRQDGSTWRVARVQPQS
ncbi:protein kinase domain-containing protein [Demequina aurantiaca]|uniref:protein kinase domain-containing protein n=1 Tax=Demequina aurantiaca TaxID=676200 RepID=UPI0007809AAC|nr:hypothetical protein [Demequina aurantiaca]